MSTENSPTSSPAVSPSPSRSSSRRSKAQLSIDLSAIPPLVQPAPPSNTLLITNLRDVDIFRADNLQTIRELVDAAAPLQSWSPLRSLRRIIVSFYDDESAIRVRSILDGEMIMGERVRVYFGQPTPIRPQGMDHLNLPDAGKLFFISPPPSPPHGWEAKREDAPNKLVHAEDLAEALAKLHHAQQPRSDLPASPVSVNGEGEVSAEGDASAAAASAAAADRRQRSGSTTTIYHPSQHGHSPHLPAIEVEDLTGDYGVDEVSPLGQEKPIMAHTSRPPIELMHE